MEGRKVAITVRDRHVDEERGGRVDWEHGLQEMGCASGCKWRVGVVGVERRRGGNAGMKGSMCNGSRRTAWRKVRTGEKGRPPS